MGDLRLTIPEGRQMGNRQPPLGDVRLMATGQLPFVEKPLSPERRYRLVEIAHETTDREKREAA